MKTLLNSLSANLSCSLVPVDSPVIYVGKNHPAFILLTLCTEGERGCGQINGKQEKGSF